MYISATSGGSQSNFMICSTIGVNGVGKMLHLVLVQIRSELWLSPPTEVWGIVFGADSVPVAAFPDVIF